MTCRQIHCRRCPGAPDAHALADGSHVRHLSVVRAKDRLLNPRIEVGAHQNHLLRMYSFDRVERNHKVAGVFHVNNNPISETPRTALNSSQSPATNA